MAVDSYEEEQLENLKKWWKENGTAVILGTALGFALLFAWRGWQTYTQGKAEAASNTYEQVLALVSQDKSQDALKAAQTLLGEYPDSAYAAFSALILASQDVKQNQVDSALARLDWVIGNAKLPELQQLAKLRKARILLSKQDYDSALGLLQGEPGGFKAAYEELKGDIAVARKQPAQAREAYTAALAETTLAGPQRQWVQLKLDDLGPVGEAAGEVIAAAFKQPPAEAVPAPAEPAPSAAQTPVQPQ